ncbi:MAG: hypothetical protein M1831_005122 [Alyxoria varia]|nr:MAG: hypothetical protein M1831_005122 [Alyxoria varia]
MPLNHGVTIVGAGIAGLTLGRALHSKGIPVWLYDRAKADARHQYSITLQPYAYEPLLRILGIDITSFHDKVAVAPTSGIPASMHSSQSPSFRANRHKLESLLKEELTIHHGHELSGLQRHSDGTYFLSFGEREQLQVANIVAADGPLSYIRSSLLPNFGVKVHPLVVFNGKRWVTGSSYDKIVPHFRNGATFRETKHGDTLLQTYINEYGDRKANISYTYSRPPRSSDDPMHKPNRAVVGARDIPPEYYTELDNMTANLEQPYRTIFNRNEVISGQSRHWLMRTAMVDEQDALSLAQRNVFLLGDSMHAMPILGSNGANVAILDALKLSEYIADDSSVEEFFRSRYATWKEEVKAGEKRLASMHQSEKAVL